MECLATHIAAIPQRQLWIATSQWETPVSASGSSRTIPAGQCIGPVAAKRPFAAYRMRAPLRQR
jgi:hypothetical protein